MTRWCRTRSTGASRTSPTSPRRAQNLQIRWTNQGKQFPAPLGTVPQATWIGAGYPDYPWIFGTDAEYTAFAAVVGRPVRGDRGPPARAARRLRHPQRPLGRGHPRGRSPTARSGSATTRGTRIPTAASAYDFNTDETVKFPSTVALLWRWTGDNAFRDEMYDFTVRNLRYVVNNLDADHDGWPEGLGNVERTGMGAGEAGQHRLLHPRSVRPGRHGAVQARRRHLRLGEEPGPHAAAALRQRPGGTRRPCSTPTRSTTRATSQSFQKHWIGQTPMEAELHVNGRTVPGLAPYDHGNTALAGRENPCFSGTPPFNPGLFHTGCGGGPTGAGEKVIFGLTTSIQSVGEGNYGRLGPGQQQRYTHALAETMFAEPATGGTPDEQPGAMPEIFPSPDQGANIDRCWTCRSMFMQAWGNYGTAWAVVHQWLGVGPTSATAARLRAAGAAGPEHRPGTGHPARLRIGRRARHAQRQPLRDPGRREPRSARRHDRDRAHAAARQPARHRHPRRPNRARLPGAAPPTVASRSPPRPGQDATR